MSAESIQCWRLAEARAAELRQEAAERHAEREAEREEHECVAILIVVVLTAAYVVAQLVV